MTGGAQKDDGKDITLKDVVVHMQHMEQRLNAKLEEHDKKFDRLQKTMGTLETNLTQRMDTLEEDLTATMKETYSIRQHVGMAATFL